MFGLAFVIRRICFFLKQKGGPFEVSSQSHPNLCYELIPIALENL